MAKYLLFAHTDCADPSREEEFNDWYDNIHVPDALQTPGMIRATRWVNVDPESNQRTKYLAMYEIETDDIKKFDATMTEVMKRARAIGRISDLIIMDPKYPRIRPFYRQIMPPKKARRSRK